MTRKQHLERWQKELLTCTMCGYCKNVCPPFLESIWDSESARARNILAYGLLTGEIDPDPSVAVALFDCTQCGDCTRRCPSKVKTKEIIKAARAVMVEEGLAYRTHATMVKGVISTGNIFADPEPVIPKKDGVTRVFIGCQFLSRPNQARKYIKLLEKMGLSPKVEAETCCGYPLAALGFVEDFEALKENFHQSLAQEKEIITLCPTCNAFLIEEYHLPVKHITQIIAERLADLPLQPLNIKATYHDPCDLARGCEIISEPRKILKAIGVELIEMATNKKEARCCGGGGGLIMSNGVLSDQLAVKRIREALATNCDTLITACATCEATLKRGAKAATDAGFGTITVKQLPDLVWKSLSGDKSS